MRLRGVGGEDHSDAGVVGDDRRTEEEERTQAGRQWTRIRRVHGRMWLLKLRTLEILDRNHLTTKELFS